MALLKVGQKVRFRKDFGLQTLRKDDLIERVRKLRDNNEKIEILEIDQNGTDICYFVDIGGRGREYFFADELEPCGFKEDFEVLRRKRNEKNNDSNVNVVKY